MGVRGEQGPPRPVCDRGHKRTAKSVRWRTIISKHNDGRYLTPSCRICESGRFKAYYRRNRRAQHEQRPDA